MKAESYAANLTGTVYGPLADIPLPADIRMPPASTPAPTPTATAEVTESSVPMAMSLSPDALMAYCESRLQSLDSQMNGIFTQQQQNATSTQDVNAIATALNNFPSPTGTPPTTQPTQAEIAAVNAAFATAIQDTQGTAISSQLAVDQATMTNALNGSNPPTISSDALSGITGDLKNYASELNSNSEMSMITLQSLMSQRQTAIQLTTNLVQSLGDQASSIAKNIGQ